MIESFKEEMKKSLEEIQEKAKLNQSNNNNNKKERNWIKSLKDSQENTISWKKWVSPLKMDKEK